MSTRPTVAEAIGAAILATMEGDDAGPDTAGPGTAEHEDREPGIAEHLAIVGRTAEAEVAVRGLLQHAVAGARASGASWAAIGAELGMSRQAVQQRFGRHDDQLTEPSSQERWLGPVTAFDEMPELALAGRLGWHTVEAGLMRHRMVRTDTQWEHRRVVWTGSLKRYQRDGWQLGCHAFPWVYLVRDTGLPAER